MSVNDHAGGELHLPRTDREGWLPSANIPGLKVRELFAREGGISIALLNFEAGAGIKQRHRHASNQFMFCLGGRYSYASSGLDLSPGDFYWNPAGNEHGPTTALETSLLLEIYDGPHYFDE